MKQIGIFDAAPIEQELKNTVFWNWMNIRRLNLKTDHYQVEDIILRYQKVTYPMTVKNFYEDMDCVDYFVQDYFPKTIKLIASLFEGKSVGRIVIAKLKAGAHVTPHKDEGKYCEAHDRFHLSIITNEKVFVTCDNQTAHIPKGTIWWFDNKKTHEVKNLGFQDRVHIIVDVKRAHGTGE